MCMSASRQDMPEPDIFFLAQLQAWKYFTKAYSVQQGLKPEE